MAKRENDSLSIKDLIPQMLVENKLEKGMNQISVNEAWIQVMGKGVASYTESVVLKNDTLLVKLNSSTLREELSFGKDKIINMLNQSLDKALIKRIKLT